MRQTRRGSTQERHRLVGQRTVREFRPDIQGLRAIAVLLVVLYHAHLPFLDGGFVGVDVFFVISGYLITKHILQGLTSSKFRFAEFYSRRVRRILPASLAVLCLSLAAAWLVAPPLEFARIARDAAWTALYIPNMLFAREGTNYLSASEPSLFQHYWSLGIEEQFYLLWPLLIWGIFLVARRNVRVLTWSLAIVAAASFIGSVLLTPVNQPWAFFLLPTRAWELAVGGLVALLPAMSHRSFTPGRRNAFGALGLAVLFGSAFAFDGSLPYPSFWAAVPVLATAVVIALGPYDGVLARLLGNRYAAWVGKISYSVYLVHWPLLVLPQIALSWMVPLPLWLSLLLGALSLPLGWLSYRFIEMPFRFPRSQRRRAVWGPLATAALVAVLVAGVSVMGMRSVASAELNAGEPAPAFTLSTDPVAPALIGSNLSVRLQDHQTQAAIPSGSGCNLPVLSSPIPPACTYGSSDGAPTVALVGDSHAAQWAPAFEAIAATGQITLTAHTKSGCPLHVRGGGSAESVDCAEWKENVLDVLAADPPDFVVIGSSLTSWDQSPEEYELAMRKLLTALPQSSTPVLIQDTPRFPGAPMSCLSQHLTSPAACSLPEGDAFDSAFIRVEDRLSEQFGAYQLDLTSYICADTCPVVQGNVLVFKDAHHLSKTFTSALAPAIATEVAGWTPRA
nr:acyltransferase family protein [Leucobacter luti]